MNNEYFNNTLVKLLVEAEIEIQRKIKNGEYKDRFKKGMTVEEILEEMNKNNNGNRNE